ncbi:hypothetical protein [Fontivita pretiosa]|uniref:hypothetical protein n=1 Tax=Fontivita pretiosa TaxID=2989684 RepID=UPI003D173BFB
MSETAEPAAVPVESPPATPLPANDDPFNAPGSDPRQALHRLASELRRTRNRRLLVEFLQLRRALR